MGWVCAKAIHDGRLLDLPLSTPLCHTLLGRPLERADLAMVCPDVYKTLEKLDAVVAKKGAILKDSALSADAKVPHRNPKIRKPQPQTRNPKPYFLIPKPCLPTPRCPILSRTL